MGRFKKKNHSPWSLNSSPLKIDPWNRRSLTWKWLPLFFRGGELRRAVKFSGSVIPPIRSRRSSRLRFYSFVAKVGGELWLSCTSLLEPQRMTKKRNGDFTNGKEIHHFSRKVPQPRIQLDHKKSTLYKDVVSIIKFLVYISTKTRLLMFCSATFSNVPWVIPSLKLTAKAPESWLLEVGRHAPKTNDFFLENPCMSYWSRPPFFGDMLVFRGVFSGDVTVIVIGLTSVVVGLVMSHVNEQSIQNFTRA